MNSSRNGGGGGGGGGGRKRRPQKRNDGGGGSSGNRDRQGQGGGGSRSSRGGNRDGGPGQEGGGNRGGGGGGGGGGRQRSNQGGGGQNREGGDAKFRNRRGRGRKRSGGRPGGGPRNGRQREAQRPEVLEPCEGILDLMSDGYGFLRSQKNTFLPDDSDVFVPQAMVRKHSLRAGVEIVGGCGIAKGKSRNTLFEIETVNGEPAEERSNPPHFKQLTSIDPHPKFCLDSDDPDISLRVVDLISPIGRGQRALIVAPPRTGKTILLQKIANAIAANHPEVHIMMVLIDERPEEVTDMKRSIQGEVIASCSDGIAKGHVRVAEMALERARRLVEEGRDVVMFVDSLTRLGRAYNLETGNSGRTLSGGLDARTMEKPRELFGSARNAEEGGSLTIIATALIDTGSRMDQVIFEEFKGTGNMELVLSRPLADRRIWPAIDINPSGTRKEEKLREPGELKAIWMLRRVLNQLKPIEGMELLVDKLQKTPSNEEFLGRFKMRADSVHD